MFGGESGVTATQKPAGDCDFDVKASVAKLQCAAIEPKPSATCGRDINRLSDFTLSRYRGDVAHDARFGFAQSGFDAGCIRVADHDDAVCFFQFLLPFS